MSAKPNQSNKKNIKNKKNKKIMTLSERLGREMLVCFFVLILLIGRLGWLQIVQGADLKTMAHAQQLLDDTISPKRGTIYDATGKALARSAQVDTVSITPSDIKVLKNRDEIDEEKTKALKEKVAKAFSDIFEKYLKYL